MIQNLPHCGNGQLRPIADDFSAFVLEAFGLRDERVQPNLVTVIGRRPYLAHPRASNIGNVWASRHLDNEVHLCRIFYLLF